MVIEFEEQPEDSRVDDVLDRLRRHRHALEIGRVLDIGRTHVPGVGGAGGRSDLLPVGVAVEHAGIFGLEHLRGDGVVDEILDFLAGRPDVREIDGLAALVVADRLLGEVDLHRAGERVGDDQRRRGEIVGAHVGIDAPLEIAIAREHRGRDEIVLGDRRRNRRRQRARIADAGRAAVADDVEAELVERLLQFGGFEIFLDDLAARRQRGLHPRLDGRGPWRRRCARGGPRRSSRSDWRCWCRR